MEEQYEKPEKALTPDKKLAAFLEKKMAQIEAANQYLANLDKPQEQRIQEAQDNLKKVFEQNKKK